MKLILPDLTVLTYEDGPIAVYVDENDKKQIESMPEGTNVYALFVEDDEEWPLGRARVWIKQAKAACEGECNICGGPLSPKPSTKYKDLVMWDCPNCPASDFIVTGIEDV